MIHARGPAMYAVQQPIESDHCHETLNAKRLPLPFDVYIIYIFRREPNNVSTRETRKPNPWHAPICSALWSPAVAPLPRTRLTNFASPMDSTVLLNRSDDADHLHQDTHLRRSIRGYPSVSRKTVWRWKNSVSHQHVHDSQRRHKNKPKNYTATQQVGRNFDMFSPDPWQ